MICKNHLMQLIFDSGRDLAFEKTSHSEILDKCRKFFTDDPQLNMQVYGLISNCFHMICYRTEILITSSSLTYDISKYHPQLLNEIENTFNQTYAGKTSLNAFCTHWDDLIDYLDENELLTKED